MSWFKVDDHLHAHRKAMHAGTEAMGLWILAGSWSAAEESDGWVPSYVLRRLAGDIDAVAAAERLVAAGLWHPLDRDGADGYVFHQWEEFQPTKAQLEEKRERNRERMRGVRSQGGKGAEPVRAHTADSADDVRSTPTRPDPTPKNITAADAAEFESWWEGFPRKVGKNAAAKAYAKARKSTSAQELVDGLANACAVWTAERTEARFIPHPATWLNRGSWQDAQDPLPGTVEESARVVVTLMQCEDGQCPGSPHRWSDGRYHCQGA